MAFSGGVPATVDDGRLVSGWEQGRGRIKAIGRSVFLKFVWRYGFVGDGVVVFGRRR